MSLPYRSLAPVALACCALLCTALAGCSSLNPFANKIDYHSAADKRSPSLEVPPDLSTPIYDERYQLKDQPSSGTTYSAYDRERAGQPRGAQSGVLPVVGQDKVRIERAGNERWLVVKLPPEAVWNEVREFWLANGFTIGLERPDIGVMETDWAENRGRIPEDGVRKLLGKVIDFAYSTDERDKFRTRLERGAEPNTTEVYISHRGMQEVSASGDNPNRHTGFVWQPRQPDPQLEAEMLHRLELRIAGPAPTQVAASEKARMAADTTLPHARIEKATDVALLKVDDGFDRAWRRVGLALDRVGFTVVDRDRSKGLYYVRYADPDVNAAREKGKGWLSKLAFWRRDEESTKTEQYRILVTDRGAASEVRVQDKNGTLDKSGAADRILNLLLAQLK